MSVVSLDDVSLNTILKSDGVTLTTAVETTVQRKGTVDNQNFQTQMIPCTSPVDDRASSRAAENCSGKGILNPRGQAKFNVGY